MDEIVSTLCTFTSRCLDGILLRLNRLLNAIVAQLKIALLDSIPQLISKIQQLHPTLPA